MEAHKVKVTTFPVPYSISELFPSTNAEGNKSRHGTKEKLLSRALKYHTQGNLSKASNCYQHLLDKGFTDSRIFLNYGTLLISQGNLKKAEECIRRSIQLEPSFAEAHLNLGNILKNLGKLKEAEISILKSLEIKPNFIEANFNLANLYQELQKLEEAEKELIKIIKLKPYFAEAYSNLGSVLQGLGRLKEAEINTRKAIEIKPDLASAFSNLGSIKKQLGNSKEAKFYWKKAIALDPNLNNTKFLLAERLYYEKNYELALQYLSKEGKGRFKSLYLSCLLCLDREKEIQSELKDITAKRLCNAEMSGIIEHANIIYGTNNKSSFCNKAINYIFHDKINEDLLSEDDFNQLISYIQKENLDIKSQVILKNGLQTSGNLFALEYPFIKSIKKAIEKKIILYREKFKDSQEGLIRNWPKDYKLSAWMISMKSGGYLKQHNHEYGWITGSFYLQLPKYKTSDNAGSLAFSYEGPQYPNKGKKFDLTFQTLEERDICIFPSSIFHQTIPFESNEERICFVFDLVQANQL